MSSIGMCIWPSTRQITLYYLPKRVIIVPYITTRGRQCRLVDAQILMPILLSWRVYHCFPNCLDNQWHGTFQRWVFPLIECTSLSAYKKVIFPKRFQFNRSKFELIKGQENVQKTGKKTFLATRVSFQNTMSTANKSTGYMKYQAGMHCAQSYLMFLQIR